MVLWFSQVADEKAAKQSFDELWSISILFSVEKLERLSAKNKFNKKDFTISTLMIKLGCELYRFLHLPIQK